MGEDPSVIKQQIEETRERMGETVDAIGYKADVPARAKDSLTEKVGAVKDKLTDATSQVTQQLSGAGEQITGTATQIGEAAPDAEDLKLAGRRAVSNAQENPLGLAIGAAAAGFLAGMLLPATRIEDERVGAVADQVKEQVRQTGGEALDRGRQVAQQTAQTVVENVQQAAGDASDQAQRAVEEQVEGLKQSAQQSAQQVRENVSS